MHTTQITVKGMTCGHCVQSVEKEIKKIDGVVDTNIELTSGLVSIESSSPLDLDKLQHAVKEAGYSTLES